MPITTRTGRAVLLPLPFISAVTGFAYMLAPDRLDTPSFNTARAAVHLVAPDAMPGEVWGVMFLFGATLTLGGILTQHRVLTTVALYCGGLTYLWWAAALLGAALTTPGASLNAWAIYAFVAYAHYVAGWVIFTRRFG